MIINLIRSRIVQTWKSLKTANCTSTSVVDALKRDAEIDNNEDEGDTYLVQSVLMLNSRISVLYPGSSCTRGDRLQMCIHKTGKGRF